MEWIITSELVYMYMYIQSTSIHIHCTLYNIYYNNTKLTKVLCFDEAREGGVEAGARVNRLKLLGQLLEVTVSLPNLTLHVYMYMYMYVQERESKEECYMYIYIDINLTY